MIIFLIYRPNSSISPNIKYFLDLSFLIALKLLIAFFTDNGFAL